MPSIVSLVGFRVLGFVSALGEIFFKNGTLSLCGGVRARGGPKGQVLIADLHNHALRLVSDSGAVSSLRGR